MVERTMTVDVLTLEDFQRRLSNRLREAQRVLSKLNSELQCRPPALGTFQDGNTVSQRYLSIHQQHVDRVNRLTVALEAALTATSTIIRNYRTTEARNQANAADISGVLAGVDAALKDGGQTYGR